MAATRRLQKELADLQKSDKPEILQVKDLGPANDQILKWNGTIFPEKEPYNKGAYTIIIEFPVEYPFKPPKVTFKTPIYHPNVDEKGSICLSVVDKEHWKPATKVEHILTELVRLIETPECDHPLRTDIATEFQKDYKSFVKSAEDHAKKHAPRS
ncbi:Oidioi.mRNA.OKI2018_I69.chr2.g7717.t1.cds [Oikopleura dioica]|uniref:Oidioi.mRNA.OKI2018_I69.chr2.g7717.t1.cds n=1 Tax=Oikopleura dioica TaxID=34765 RepID=A0ABN7TAI1_OIKDI|nr:Oidioi.mRNA.OKI2018_I69.chr2.g7717.t1.cds [Oikopleura dioica]